MRYVCSESSGSRIFSGMRANRRKLASRCCRLHSFLLPGNHSHDVIIIILQKLSWTSLSEWQRYLDTVSYKKIPKATQNYPAYVVSCFYVCFKFGNCVSKDLCYLLYFRTSPLCTLSSFTQLLCSFLFKFNLKLPYPQTVISKLLS